MALRTHRSRETFKQVETVLWSWACLGVMLNRKNSSIAQSQTTVGAIEQRHMGFDHIVG